MAEPTLQQIFGANATQDTTTITISKTDLATTGLTSTATNTAESLLTAIVLLASEYANPTTQETNADIQITIEDSGFPLFTTRSGTQYIQTTYNINFQVINTANTLDPNNF